MGAEGLRWLVVLMWVLCGCGAKHETAQPASGGDDANPEATVNERITATELEQSDDPEEDTEEEPDEREEDEEPEEQEEQDEEEEETEEQDEPEVSASAPDFNYDEWTAEPPTLGKPKVPGPPYPYLEAGGKKELFDRLRRYRWLAWEHEKTVDMEEAWIANWEKWEAEGHPVRELEHGKCHHKLRENDPALKELVRKYEREKAHPVVDNDLELKLQVYGGKAAYEWFLAVKKITGRYPGINGYGSRVYKNGILLQRSRAISTRAGSLSQRLGRAAGCKGRRSYFQNCPTPNIRHALGCQDWKSTFMED